MKNLFVALRQRLGAVQMVRRFYRFLPSGKRSLAALDMTKTGLADTIVILNGK